MVEVITGGKRRARFFMRSKGIITVEASIIVTCATAIFLFIFFMGCFMCDMHRIQAECSAAAKREMNSVSQCMNLETGEMDWSEWGKRTLTWRLTYDLTNYETNIKDELEKKLNKSIWFSNKVDVEVNMSADHIDIEYSGIWHSPMEVRLFITGGVPFEGHVELIGTQTEELIRTIGGLIRGFGG